MKTTQNDLFKMSKHNNQKIKVSIKKGKPKNFIPTTDYELLAVPKIKVPKKSANLKSNKKTLYNILNNKHNITLSNQYKSSNNKDQNFINTFNDWFNNINEKNNININYISKKYINIDPEVFDEYTFNSSVSVNWYDYIDKIYLLHTKYKNSRTFNNLLNVGITDYDIINYRTDLPFSELKYYKSAAFLNAVYNAYENDYNHIMILRDDIKFLDNEEYILDCLNKSKIYNCVILNPHDIATDCIILDKGAIQKICQNKFNIKQLNWNQKLNNVLESLKTYKAKIDICLHLIDFVMPYVNGNDEEWIKIHEQYIDKKDNVNSKNRFRDWNNLNYIFRGLETYTKFIDNVFLIVMQDSQVPEWINRETVNIVYHKDFIPEDKLPCFSSSLIETYLMNIPELSEYMLYGNDDTFIIRETCRKEWFENGWPCININRFSLNTGDKYFTQLCKRSYDLASKEFPKKNNNYYRPGHDITSLMRSSGEHIYALYKDILDESAYRFRVDKDFNQYLYSIYMFNLANKHNNVKILSKYIGLTNDNIKLLKNINSYVKVCCINDCLTDNKNFDKICNDVNNILLKYYSPAVCKYEK